MKKIQIKRIKIKDKVDFPKGEWVNITHEKYQDKVTEQIDETIYFYVENNLNLNLLKVRDKIELDKIFTIIGVE